MTQVPSNEFEVMTHKFENFPDWVSKVITCGS